MARSGTPDRPPHLVGTHDAYITALALNGSTIVAAGRARTTAAPGTLLSIAARYHAVGGPAPMPGVTPPLTAVTPRRCRRSP